MSIRSTILLSLLSVVALYGACVYAIQRTTLLPSFEALESDEAVRHLARATQALEKDISTLDATCHDWAAWDDTWNYALDHDEKYTLANLDISAFQNRNFDLVRVQSLDGQVPCSIFRDPTQAFAQRPLRGFQAQAWAADHPLLANRDPERGVTGLVSTDAGLMLVASRPIVDSLKQQPSHGWLIMGLLLTPDHVQRLCEQTRLRLQMFQLGASTLDRADETALHSLLAGGRELLAPRDDALLQAYTTLPDLRGKPALLVRADLPRAVMARGRHAMEFVLGSTLAAALLLLGVLFVLLRRTIVRPLGALSAHVLAVGTSGDLAQRMNSTRRDEFGLLANAFDGMVVKLSQTREALLRRARSDGRAEVAISVLHSVGNVLNSVNVSTGALQVQVSAGALTDAGRLAATLAAHEGDLALFIAEDPRGQHLPAYLTAFSRSLVEERERMLGELAVIAGCVEHIRALVDSQQAAVQAYAEPEPVDLGQEIEAALKLSPDLPGATPVRFVRTLQPLPPLLLARHRLLEIVVNLVTNARQALHEAAGPDPCIRITVERPAGDRVRISVSDNGPGIEPEHMPQLFLEGFTTRPGGHGIGLPSSARAAAELGGTLTAYSDGQGAGARFVLEFPLRLARQAA